MYTTVIKFKKVYTNSALGMHAQTGWRPRLLRLPVPVGLRTLVAHAPARSREGTEPRVTVAESGCAGADIARYGAPRAAAMVDHSVVGPIVFFSYAALCAVSLWFAGKYLVRRFEHISFILPVRCLSELPDRARARCC